MGCFLGYWSENGYYDHNNNLLLLLLLLRSNRMLSLVLLGLMVGESEHCKKGYDTIVSSELSRYPDMIGYSDDNDRCLLARLVQHLTHETDSWHLHSFLTISLTPHCGSNPTFVGNRLVWLLTINGNGHESPLAPSANHRSTTQQ